MVWGPARRGSDGPCGPRGVSCQGRGFLLLPQDEEPERRGHMECGRRLTDPGMRPGRGRAPRPPSRQSERTSTIHCKRTFRRSRASLRNQGRLFLPSC